MAKKSLTKGAKPSKPRRDYPLTAHPSGQWCKRVNGKLYYFGKWDDPQAAEEKWEARKHAILNGRDFLPGAIAGDSLGWLCNAFLESKRQQLERGELTQRSWDDYKKACTRIAEHFGKGRKLETIKPIDFEQYRNVLPSSWGPTTTNNHLRLLRALFRYCNAIQITEQPIAFQLGTRSVPKSVSRKHAAAKPAKEFDREEILALIKSADVPMRSFVYLGINCAYGPADIGRLKVSDIDFETQWLGVLRGKTGITRGCQLWPETLEALQASIDAKPWTGNPERDALFSLTRNRRPWFEDGVDNNPMQQAFGKLKKAAGITKRGVGHYALRHSFATQASGVMDQQAIDFVMGHHDPSIRNVYREGIDPDRVRKVCTLVREWLRPWEVKGGAS